MAGSGDVPVTADQQKIGKTLRWMHFAAALFMGIQVIAYGSVGASATVKPTVGFPTYCDGRIEYVMLA